MVFTIEGFKLIGRRHDPEGRRRAGEKLPWE